MPTTSDPPSSQRRKRTRVTGAERQELITYLVERYVQQGETIRHLAVVTGRGYGTVHQMLVEAGVTLRPRGGRRPHGHRAATGPIRPPDPTTPGTSRSPHHTGHHAEPRTMSRKGQNC